MSACGYCRVSTSMQKEDGISLDTQKKRIQEYCDYKGLQLTKHYEDAGISGRDLDRPALQQLLSEVQSGQYVIISDLSRLSRNTYHALGLFEHFKKNNINFVCLNPNIDFSTPIGVLVYTVMMSIHELERKNISMHVSGTMQVLSKQGKLRARSPFGYRFVAKDKELEPEPEQQRIISKIIEMYNNGINYSSIARTLNEEGEGKHLNNNKTKQLENPQFYAQTVKRILEDCCLVETKDGRKPIATRIACHKTKKEEK